MAVAQDSGSARRGAGRGGAGGWRTATVVLAAALVVALTALVAVGAAAVRAYPESSPEVGFARDMYRHHDQAVVMSLLVRERGTDPEVAQIARDIITGQGEEEGVLRGWLLERDVPVTTGQEPMAWMGAGHGTAAGAHEPHDMGAAPAPTAPAEEGGGDEAALAAMGMASDEELSELGRLTGSQADLLYLQLMQRHHRGAVDMAGAFLDLSDEPQLSRLAEGALTTQERELRLLAAAQERLGG